MICVVGIVQHDCLVGNHVHLSTGVKVASTVQIEDGAHIGAGAVFRQGLKIGEGAVVGAGAVVVKDVVAESVVVGVLARSITVRVRS